MLYCFHAQRKPINPSGNKKSGASKKDTKNNTQDGKAEGESSTDLTTAVEGGLSLEKQTNNDQ